MAVAVIAEQYSGHDYDGPGKPAIAWNDERARAQLVDPLVPDGLAVLQALTSEQAEPRAAEALALLALIAGQDVELVDEGSDSPRWRIAQRVAPDRVISTVDPDAWHARKTVTRRQDGTGRSSRGRAAPRVRGRFGPLTRRVGIRRALPRVGRVWRAGRPAHWAGGGSRVVPGRR
jgi:hypothetical protein